MVKRLLFKHGKVFDTWIEEAVNNEEIVKKKTHHSVNAAGILGLA